MLPNSNKLSSDNEVMLDDLQLQLQAELINIANVLNAKKKNINILGKIFRLPSKFLKPNDVSGKRLVSAQCHIKGIYLFGKVGRGKTMLMNQFFTHLEIPKKIVHFQAFMHNLHNKLHLLRDEFSNNNKIIERLAAELAQDAGVLCLDEFEIKDITDAMMVMRLFQILLAKGVFIFVTTNTEPDNLYKDGIQRSSFLPFIVELKKDFLVLNLSSDIDYRLIKAGQNKNKILFPYNSANQKALAKIKNSLCNSHELEQGQVELFGRKVVFEKTHNNVLFTDFTELFERDLSYADYVKICEKFRVIVVEKVRIITENETDVAIRLINFIDNAYFSKTILFAILEAAPSELYVNGKRAMEFERAVSRLAEMNNN